MKLELYLLTTIGTTAVAFASVGVAIAWFAKYRSRRRAAARAARKPPKPEAKISSSPREVDFGQALQLNPDLFSRFAEPRSDEIEPQAEQEVRNISPKGERTIHITLRGVAWDISEELERPRPLSQQAK
jgi:ABC-type protease/lipase transport system fused ATPase/permease subunit